MKKQAIQILVIVLGALALGYGVYVTFFERNGYIKSTAVIEQIDEIFSGVDGDGASEYTYDVYIRFTTADGEKIRTKCDWYNPENPEQVHGDNRLLGVILMIVGPLVAAGSAYGIVQDKRRENGANA